MWFGNVAFVCVCLVLPLPNRKLPLVHPDPYVPASCTIAGAEIGGFGAETNLIVFFKSLLAAVCFSFILRPDYTFVWLPSDQRNACFWSLSLFISKSVCSCCVVLFPPELSVSCSLVHSLCPTRRFKERRPIRLTRWTFVL